ncbi:MAG TPA: Gfo/Idh/MocA family oxidoreductase [Armatimonadota bacterium]|nr:Gfo/Idh/MocA family oxidoreductase [Armatimonadota bacterium]
MCTMAKAKKAIKTSPKKSLPSEIRMAVIGYGGAFNMGKAHASWGQAAPGFRFVAACDIDPARAAAAAEDFPGIETYTDVDTMLRKCDFDLVTIVTPHNTHAPLAIQCARAGKHVVVEKPMCITTQEGTDMIAAAKKAGTCLTVFHNRRHDGDYLAVKEIVDKGMIGDVFKVEMCMGGYDAPGTWWRSDKAISGGAFYDWGAHILDWLLHVVPQRIEHVMGYFHKLVWHQMTNEDHVHAVIKFVNGATADVQLSTIQRIGKPRWRILGTKGAIVDTGQGKFHVVTELKGMVVEMDVPYRQSSWQNFYDNLSAHLLKGKPLEVTPESARRVIAIMEAAEVSSQTGQPQPVPYDDTLHL